MRYLIIGYYKENFKDFFMNWVTEANQIAETPDLLLEYDTSLFYVIKWWNVETNMQEQVSFW